MGMTPTDDANDTEFWDDPEPGACLNCGMCEWCIERSIALAEEMDPAMVDNVSGDKEMSELVRLRQERDDAVNHYRLLLGEIACVMDTLDTLQAFPVETPRDFSKVNNHLRLQVFSHLPTTQSREKAKADLNALPDPWLSLHVSDGNRKLAEADAAKLRRALLDIMDDIDQWNADRNREQPEWWLAGIKDKARAALRA